MTGPRARKRDSVKSRARHNTFSRLSFDISRMFIKLRLGSVKLAFVS